MTRKDIMCEPGAERIAYRSTQGEGRHIKSRWTELEIWFRHQANGRPPFVTIVTGHSTHFAEETRETVTEAATLRIAGTHFMRDTAPANAVRRDAEEWYARHMEAGGGVSLVDVIDAAYSIAADAAIKTRDGTTKAQLAGLLAMLEAHCSSVPPPEGAFDKIKAGLDDAVAYAGGDTSRGRAHRVQVGGDYRA